MLIAWLVLAANATAQKHTSKDSAVTLTVYGNCEQCKQRIETAVKGRGVTAASWDIDSKVLSLVYNPAVISLDRIEQKIANTGHDTQHKKAKDDTYNSLPSCCLYRANEKAVMDAALTQPQPDSAMATEAVAEGFVKGVVLELDGKGSFAPLASASVYWLTTQKGVVTDSNGVFSIQQNAPGSRLVISYAGYQADTVAVASQATLRIILASGNRLKDVTVVAGSKGYYASTLTAVRTQVWGEKELFKAACCNLSESFETNPSVDVSYNDAVSGSRQIQLLGLSGTYTQLTVENMPGPRGIATANGLSFIPGPWIESIQLTKGTGSVANGYESIAGQINIEEKKPEKSEKLYLNAYVNDFGKTDINLNLSQKIGAKWSTALLLHDDFLANKNMDVNKDGFRDLPTGNQFTILNRWRYDNSNGFMLQFGVKVLRDDKTGGQLGFTKAEKLTTNLYGLGLSTERYEAFGKIGYVFPQKKYKSVGLQLATFSHTQNDYFGLAAYDAKQQNFYGNLIYQSIIGNTNHKFRAGVSFLYDNYTEVFKTLPYQRLSLIHI